MADDGWQQQQDLRRFALSSQPLDIERLRMQGWQQGLPVPELGMSDWLSEDVHEENAAARFGPVCRPAHCPWQNRAGAFLGPEV